MAEVKITYETLFDILRRERNREELQELDASFYEDTTAYLVEKKALVAGSGADALSMSAESERARIQYHNIKKILKEIYDRREKKITMLALNSVRTGMTIDQGAFLAQERLLFQDLLAQFAKYRREVLETIFAGSVSSHAPITSSAKPELSSSEESGLKSSVEQEKTSPTETETSSSPLSSSSSSPSTPSSSSPSIPTSSSENADMSASSASPGKIKVRFLKPVPRFAGAGEVVLGPFSIGDEADLPEQIASVLLKKARVEHI